MAEPVPFLHFRRSQGPLASVCRARLRLPSENLLLCFGFVCVKGSVLWQAISQKGVAGRALGDYLVRLSHVTNEETETHRNYETRLR